MSPTPIEGVAGVTAIETSVAAVTVSVVIPVTPPLTAEMAVVPTASAEASPVDEIVAVAGVPDFQVAVVEMSFVVLSLNVPVATNCCRARFAIDGSLGVTAIETSVAAGGGGGKSSLFRRSRWRGRPTPST